MFLCYDLISLSGLELEIGGMVSTLDLESAVCNCVSSYANEGVLIITWLIACSVSVICELYALKMYFPENRLI